MTRLTVLLAAAVFAASNVEAAPRTNVVLIMIDDYGYECVGANGGTSYSTPRLDQMAREGARGTHFHAQPLCTPTRVQLMTGQYNVRNYTRFGHLERSQTTIGHLFRRAGYATCIAGKWQLGRDMSLPAHFGFDKYCLWQLDRRPPRYANAGLEIDGRHVDLTGGGYGPDMVNQYARDFVTENKDRPFLLYYPMMLTHAPFQPTPDSDDWDPTTNDERARQHPKHFADMVAYADKLIGKLLDTLDEQGLRDRTLVIVIGDNGTPRGVVSYMGETKVEGGKGHGDHTGTHVPFLAQWPGKISPGTVLDDVSDTTDLLPTICEAAGVAVPGELVLDGRSLVPRLVGDQGEPREWSYCWYARGGGPTADIEFAQSTNYKLYRDGRLFDLERDLDEQHPLDEAKLSAEAATAKKMLSAALAKYTDVRPAAIIAQAENKGKRKAGK